MTKRLIGALPGTLVLGPPAVAQDPPAGARREGALQRFVDMDTKDVQARLELLQQHLYIVERQLTVLTFMQRHGDRVRIEPVNFANVDYDLTPGYVFEPVQREPGKQYPGLVIIHGGYHWSLDQEFFPLFARAVDEGYVVIFPEYRGSSGYGSEHYNALNYGGKEVDDVLSAASYLASRDYVDASRMGIYGRSKGGMLALLAIQKQPRLFKAAVDVVGLADFVAYMSYKPDYRRRDVARQPNFGGLPNENLPAYIDVSPITHVDKIETPLLVLATGYDRTVPVELHTQRLIDALQARGKTFEYKIYDHAPGGHGYSHGDTPEGRDSRNRVFAFLKKYLKP